MIGEQYTATFNFFLTAQLHTRVKITDIDWRSQNLRHLYPGMGLQLGYSGFSCNQNNCDLAGAYVLQSEHESKHAWNVAWQVKIVGAVVCVCFRMCGRQKPE